MVWGDFRGARNETLAGSLLRYQKRFAGLVAGKWGLYHSDPLFAQFGMLKVGDLYRQQLRVHAWRFSRGLLPAGQAAMLDRVGDIHQYATRSARTGIALTARDHRVVGYRVPREWAKLTEGQRRLGSRVGFLAGCGSFVSCVKGCVSMGIYLTSLGFRSDSNCGVDCLLLGLRESGLQVSN